MAESDSPTTIKLQGIDLQVRRKGKGAPLLMLHGGGGPMSGFPFTDALARHFEIIEPVHPGFAGTPIPAQFDNHEDLVYLYLDLIDHLGLKDAVVMGHSMGGWTAAEIAVRNSSRIGKLILVDAVGVKVSGRDTRDIVDVFATSQKELNRLAWHNPARAPDPSAMSMDALKIVAGNRVALGMYGWDPYLHNPKLRQRLHRVKVPTLFVWGASDGIVTPAYGRGFQAMIPGAQMVVIEFAGHSPQVEQPDAFVEQVLKFAGEKK